MRSDGPLSADGLAAATLHEVCEDAPAHAFVVGHFFDPFAPSCSNALGSGVGPTPEQTRRLRTGGSIRKLQFWVSELFASLNTTCMPHPPRCEGGVPAMSEPSRLGKVPRLRTNRRSLANT